HPAIKESNQRQQVHHACLCLPQVLILRIFGYANDFHAVVELVRVCFAYVLAHWTLLTEKILGHSFVENHRLRMPAAAEIARGEIAARQQYHAGRCEVPWHHNVEPHAGVFLWFRLVPFRHKATKAGGVTLHQPNECKARGTHAGQSVDPLRDASIEWNELSCLVLCRSEEHTSELQSRGHLVCRLLLEKKKKKKMKKTS